MRIFLLHLTQVPPELISQISPVQAISNTIWHSEKSVELHTLTKIQNDQRTTLRKLANQFQVDCIFLKDDFDIHQVKLLVFDMDSTLINIECIDEIARQVGKSQEVSAITEATMRGEITDFSVSLKKRVQILAGTPESAMQTVYEQRLALNLGAENLLIEAKKYAWQTLLVSGGFTFFTDRIKVRLQIDHAYSNTLEIQDQTITGKVLGPIVDGQAKANFLQHHAHALGIQTNQTIVLGDGSNDLPMMALAGLSIGFRAKPVVQEKADGSFNHVGLDGLLGLFG